MNWYKVVPISIVGFVANFCIILVVSKFAEIPATNSPDLSAWVELIGMVVVSPVTETLLLYLIFFVLKMHINEKTSAIASSALLAAMHGFVWNLWPIVVLPAILASVVPLIVGLNNYKKAFAQSFTIHAINNFLVWLVAYVVF